MTTDDLLQALARLRVETGSLACLGCGREHNCSTHGCQILREAAAQLEHFTAENRALRNALATKPTKRSLYARATYLREMVKELNAQREKTEAEKAALLEKQRWIPVTERMPEPETDVLAVCNRNGYIFVIPAIYEDGKLLTQDSAWNWSDIYCYGLYDEEADDYYIPEGWWENRQFNPDDVYNNPVDCAVTHWMPMLEAPKEGGEADA